MQPIHMLTKMGILTAFSISKKITEEEVSNFFKKHKKSGKTEEQLGDMLRNKIFEEIKGALENQKLPGLLGTIQSPLSPETVIPNANDINKLVMIIAQKMTEKKYDKLSLCYFINYMVNLLGLTEKDFEKFHKKISQNNRDDDDDDDDDDDE
jgi:hypothetical protein